VDAALKRRSTMSSGLPDEFIAYIRLMVGRAIEFYSCFISYSHEDKLFARRLHDALQGRGVRCWLDEKQMLPGDDIYEQVDRGIRLWDKVLLCCSRHSTQVSAKRRRESFDKLRTGSGAPSGGWTMRLIARLPKNAT
jgi:hypothetical protein